VHQFDIVLEVLLFNQTNETLQNLSVEFATLGDLKVVERPSTQSIAPQSFHTVTTTIKVSSADAGVIFGNILYEGNTASVNNVVILDEIRVDIMDYIKPGHVAESEFRTMWSEFEWENKVNISANWPTSKGSLQSFLAFLLKNTNMACLTPGALPENDDGEYTDECQFLSANLHARSSFGEDALANLSIEKDASGKITGHVRIRSKGQGLALSLGDRVADLQRKQQFVAA
jgi:coatomer subunit beta